MSVKYRNQVVKYLRSKNIKVSVWHHIVSIDIATLYFTCSLDTVTLLFKCKSIISITLQPREPAGLISKIYELHNSAKKLLR